MLNIVVELVIYFIFLIEHSMFDVILFTKLDNRQFYLWFEAAIDYYSCCLTSSFWIGGHTFYPHKFFSVEFDLFISAMIVILIDKLS